jgi:hypothetical protein
MRNFKPPSGEGQRWDVQISSDIPAQSIVVTLSSTGSLPDGFQCFVFDQDNFNIVSVQNNSFVVGYVGQRVRTFRIVLGTPEFAEDNSGGIPLVPVEYALDQNFPNPFNPSTTITYRLAKRSNVRLEIFNLLGQRVRALVEEEQMTGAHSAVWNGENNSGNMVASGVYVYRLRAGEFSASRKLLMIR